MHAVAAPFQLMTRVVDKIEADGATAIVVAPEWPRMRWYGRLQKLAARTYRVPRRGTHLYSDIHGRTFRQRSWHTVAFLVDPSLPCQSLAITPPRCVWPVIRWMEEKVLTVEQRKQLEEAFRRMLAGEDVADA